MERYKDIITEIYFGGEKESTVFIRIKNGINGVMKNLPKF